MIFFNYTVAILITKLYSSTVISTAVEPPALVDIFSLDSESGVVTVDATGPHLLAAGTLGYINVRGV